jgi:hypothetical protein
LLVLGTLFAVFTAGSACTVGSTGDPGGRILGELQPASTAIAPDAKIRYRHDDEPRWDSCDGRPGTFGWNDAVMQIHFASALSSTAVSSHANAALLGLGWKAVYNSGVQVGWQKRLTNSSYAHAQITDDNQIDLGTWTLFVSAPPAGQRASGC